VVEDSGAYPLATMLEKTMTLYLELTHQISAST
jgi:hypothetical protein